ncbi:metalloregulator ArsR/SmtB family transcription factor [Domibacillus sp. PGB-M46]|uniref:ArsR/SmtB family transcription factor n=1 Tax=Domibacillus sp. PGB-M46 TaxID=2910255 RepID=UPI001F5A5C33|nr:metalloregulator ArsR/SmtB family transcription factor [Domibacillus sp. PGB-M46]MCI2255303.1 metalloregulator ArsR/SmtB family transcription factor [Domibacillus sp. PGB-M46]
MDPSSPKHDVFQTIADPARRNLLQLLADKEMSIAAITEHFPISRTAVNKYLQVLADANLVISQKIGRETRYRLHSEPMIELKEGLSFFEQYWDEKLSALKQFVESNND